MEISSSLFGPQEIDPDTIITFPRGLPGFEAMTRYKLFNEEGKDTVYWLQSVDDPNLIFSVAEPTLFNCTYELRLEDEEAALIELDNPDDVLVLVLLKKDEEEAEMVDDNKVKAHLKGPLIINIATQLGIQKLITKLTPITLLRAVD